jgi:hypothetical protein
LTLRKRFSVIRSLATTPKINSSKTVLKAGEAASGIFKRTKANKRKSRERQNLRLLLCPHARVGVGTVGQNSTQLDNLSPRARGRNSDCHLFGAI